MAKLNPYGRRLLCERIASGFPVRVAARMVGISDARAYVIWHRYLDEGEAAFVLRSSRPHHIPRLTPARLSRRIERLRRRNLEGPRAIGWALKVAASTVHAVLRRLGLSRLAELRRDPPVFRRYERACPGDLVHIDTKKIGRIPEGGGKRFGRHGPRADAGWEYIHVAVDDRTRVQYSERLSAEDAPASAGFLARALDHFAALGAPVREVMTDNHFSYTKSRAFAAILAERGIRHITTPPRTPRWNGKAEAFIKILLDRWAYLRPYRSNRARSVAFVRFGDSYNHRRRHGEIGGLTPMQRFVNDLSGQNS
jgi:transposase InsO family protein